MEREDTSLYRLTFNSIGLGEGYRFSLRDKKIQSVQGLNPYLTLSILLFPQTGVQVLTVSVHGKFHFDLRGKVPDNRRVNHVPKQSVSILKGQKHLFKIVLSRVELKERGPNQQSKQERLSILSQQNCLQIYRSLYKSRGSFRSVVYTTNIQTLPKKRLLLEDFETSRTQLGTSQRNKRTNDQITPLFFFPTLGLKVWKFYVFETDGK